MTRIQESILVAATPDQCWKYYSDIGHLKDWVEGGGFKCMDWLSSPPKQMGSEFRMTLRYFGRRLAWQAKITKFEEPREVQYDLVEGDYVAFNQGTRFEPTPEGSRVTFWVQYELPDLLTRIANCLLVKRLVRRDFLHMANRFKVQVEALAAGH
jgi:uncharacterized membrane protein